MKESFKIYLLTSLLFWISLKKITFSDERSYHISNIEILYRIILIAFMFVLYFSYVKRVSGIKWNNQVMYNRTYVTLVAHYGTWSTAKLSYLEVINLYKYHLWQWNLIWVYNSISVRSSVEAPSLFTVAGLLLGLRLQNLPFTGNSISNCDFV